ncbi:MAG TPA: SDR family NAD(P)-dependent oxidoreductase [Casimicrobiaceae bacterium]|nr:SDR family NAD(P)-dependent oxidoreductase [Casimicrobiaceae bacterium]
MRLEDKVAIVTGGAQGIGEGAALGFAREGARVAIVDVNGDGANAVVNAIEREGGKAIAIQADLYDVAATERMVDETMRAFGAVHILLASAGIFKAANIENTTEELWDQHLDLDLRAVFFSIKAVTPIMKRQRYGRIITVSSIAGLVGFLNSPAYCAAKGGIVNLTRAVACELAAHGITVNSIAPGPVETPINDPFNWRTPEGDAHRRYLSERTPSGVSFYKVKDITGTIVYLASDESTAVTGVAIPIDGGWCAW